MEESLGAQYAIQIAFHTLKDRCKSLQKRITSLEEENVNLRISCTRNENNERSLSEMDKLKDHITELTELKEQLQSKVKMVSNENLQLWSKLGKLTVVNKNLGDQLTKINDTVNKLTPSSHTTLVRSKTFTQEAPQSKFLQKNMEINEKNSLELEDVSLKLIDSFSKQKMELDQLCSEIAEIQSSDPIITENFGFCYEEEMEDNLIEDFYCVFEDLKVMQDELSQQKFIMEQNLQNLSLLRGKSLCKACDTRQNQICDKETSTVDLPTTSVDKFTDVQIFHREEKHVLTDYVPPEPDKICPICTKIFQKDVEFSDFQRHVEDHFIPDPDSYELL